MELGSNECGCKEKHMPCRDYYDDHPEEYYGAKFRHKDDEIAQLRQKVSFAESALCLALNTVEQLLKGIKHDFDDQIKTDPLDILEFKEAGITRKELEQWWNKHKALDQKHREEERLKKVKAEALAKLSAEERKVLGLK
jgi:hypothetical protein